MKRLLFLATGLVAVAVSAQEQWGQPDAHATPVSMFELLAAGKEFEGWRVEVRAVASFEFEGMFLFPSREHFDRFDTASAILMDFQGSPFDSVSLLSELAPNSGSYVVVHGIFNSVQRTQRQAGEVFVGSNYGGIVSHISYIEVLED